MSAVGAAFGSPLKHPTPAVTIFTTVVQDGSFVVAAIVLAGQVGTGAPWKFGLRRPERAYRAALLVGGAYAVFLLTSAAYPAIFAIKTRATCRTTSE